MAASVFAGVILLQAAWILAVPPFRAIDEFDHVYRAAGVAEGQWRLSEPATNGRGLIVAVPKDIVHAATRQCAALEYTGRDNCYPISNAGAGLVRVATAAGGYNPGYYAVVGVAARSFEGAEAAYVMRIVSALVCAAGIALAALVLARVKAGLWTRVALLTGLTPVLVYSTVVPAPNGLEMVAGLCLWSALLASSLESQMTRTMGRWLVVMATAAACLLSMLRTLGPLWMGLIVVAAGVFIGGRQCVSLLRSRRSTWAVGSVVVLLCLALGGWWSLTSGLTERSTDLDPRLDELTLGAQPMVWLLQIVGAFPTRNEPASPGVYALYFLVVSMLIVTAVAAANRRRRWVLVTTTLLVLLIPLALTFATYKTQGVIGKGVTSWPLSRGYR